MRVYAVSASLYLIGLLVFYTLGVLEQPYWVPAYFLWDKCKDLLLLLTIFSAPTKAPALIFIISFALVRFAWEIISTFTGWNINNTKAVGVLFIIAIVTICLILFKELRKWQKQNLRP